MNSTNMLSICPVCYKQFSQKDIEGHVTKCLFLNSQTECPQAEKESSDEIRNNINRIQVFHSYASSEDHSGQPGTSGRCTDATLNNFGSIPLAERMRPTELSNFFGQEHILGHSKSLRTLLEKNDVPNMILWGPPGCGKTSLAHIIASQCKNNNKRYRFAKLSATMDGIHTVREVVKIAKNEAASFKRQTLLFVDEIHRFNKIQQDVFLSHVENGVIILIGATTENPSFSLNKPLLSRCCVYVMNKLLTQDIIQIAKRALSTIGVAVVKPGQKNFEIRPPPWAVLDEVSVVWIAEVCDGDARIALNGVQLTQNLLRQRKEKDPTSNVVSLSLEEVKDCIKRSHILYDKKGDEHYNIVSALHKSIRASDDDAALYWLQRMLAGGEDPMFIARRLVRAASEDIGLADSRALCLAVSAMESCRELGMPDCEGSLAQCAVYLARAPKSTEVYKALERAKSFVAEQNDAQPPVPFHLRNIPTSLMEDKGDDSDLSDPECMPEGLEHVRFL